MKTKDKVIMISSAVAVLITSCQSARSIPALPTTPVELQTSMPTVTSLVLPSATDLPSTVTPVPLMQNSPMPVAKMPTTVVLENGLIWTECELPVQDYSYTRPDIELMTTCLGMELPVWDDGDRAKFEERVDDGNGDNLRLIIGDSMYQTRYTQSDAHDYELLENGVVVAKASAYYITFDPNRHLGNLGGKLVWEVISEPPVVIIDGVNSNEENQFEGSFFPYEVQGKLIYLARKNGQYHVVYDDNIIGPPFDEIALAYCCAKFSVAYGKGQYWFLGRRNGSQFIVAIH